MAKPGGLGRGLEALLQDGKDSETVPAAADTTDTRVQDLSLGALKPNNLQPRQNFGSESLSELVDSIKERGVLQPLLARPVDSGYEIVAGERRFRAAKIAGRESVPVIVLELSDQEALELALVENLQRADLNDIEEAEGYARLANEFGLTQVVIAQRVGKGRATVANAMRLLDLPATVRDLLTGGRLSAGHAKILLQVEGSKACERIALQCAREHWSVRTLEASLARSPRKRGLRKREVGLPDVPEHHLQQIIDRLHAHFATSVRVRPTHTHANGKKTRGTIEIDFFSNEELDRLLEVLGVDDAI